MKSLQAEAASLSDPKVQLDVINSHNQRIKDLQNLKIRWERLAYFR